MYVTLSIILNFHGIKYFNFIDQGSKQISITPTPQANLENPTPRTTEPVPTVAADSKQFVVTEETIIIKENRPLTVGDVSPMLRKSDERRQPSNQLSYYAVRERSKHGMRWQIVGLESTTPRNQNNQHDSGESKSLPAPEN
ncbi:unnamed protein product [Lymnaea stagnalis]|uniref:Uncharacterized protein n=1 Tax=Lymnaea stagnalis TaxID=6523 RepID=A0AAV2IJW5_LYMST